MRYRGSRRHAILPILSRGQANLAYRMRNYGKMPDSPLPCPWLKNLTMTTTAPIAPTHQATPQGFAFLIAILTAIGPFSITMYLPAFPNISTTLGATPVEVQQTLAAYLIPFAFMMLWHGSISDAIGRRKVILAGLFVYTLAALICLFAQNILMLSIGRALQGMAAGAGMSVGRATVLDLLKGAAAQRLMARISMLFALAPAISPLLGSVLSTAFGWRAVFVFLSCLGASLFVGVWKLLPETLPVASRQPFKAGALFRAYIQALSMPKFTFLCLALGLCVNGSMIFVLSAPHYLESIADTRFSSFAALFSCVACGMAAGSYVNSRAAGKLSPKKTLQLGFGIMLLACLINIAIVLLLPRGLLQNVIAVLIYTFGLAITMPSLQLMALEQLPTRRGLASSLQGAFQVGTNAFTSIIIAPLAWHGAGSMGMAMGGYWLAAVLMLAISGHCHRTAAR
ncbi:MAG: MFS transporter, DHA1 family, multidrug resistance protein [Rugosibacter sp.]|jgi:DHA1 family bicyclomycin/chloramphenicol resistance-like MFS transporter|nr:MFS transporter, DHA1 family, multidrug resistance protein [Rugosibacter sp.]